MTPPTAHGHARPRLHAVLDVVHRTRLAVLAAPAGTGKTTLVADWARVFPGPVAWWRADATDVARHGVAVCVGAALDRVLAITPGADVDVDALVFEVEDFDGPVLLVVDDLHVLDADATAVIQRLVQSAPANLHVVLASRALPSMTMTRSELGGLPTLVTGEDLRFRSWEVEQLFRDHYREPLRPEDVTVLTRRTDGWAAALASVRLAAAAAGGRTPEAAVRTHLDRSRYAADFLAREVLGTLPDDLVVFLRRTSVFETLTATRCAHLLGLPDPAPAQRDLDELLRHPALHGLVTPLGDHGDRDTPGARCHPVLRRHLEAALADELGRGPVRDVSLSAAEIAESDGAPVEAVLAYARAGEWSAVRRLLTSHGDVLAAARDVEWSDVLPPGFAADEPWLALAQARRLFDDGRLEPAERTAQRALHLFGEQRHGAQLAGELARSVREWRVGSAPRAGDEAPTWVEVLRRATSRAPGELVVTGLDDVRGDLVRGLAALLVGDEESSRAALDRVVAGGAQPSATAARIVRAAVRAVIEVGDTDLVRDVEQACADADVLGLVWLSRVGRGVALAAQGSAAALAQADVLARDCDRRDDPWGAALVRAALALQSLRRGTPDLALLDSLIAAFRMLRAGVPEAWARSARALVLACGEDAEAAEEARAAEAFARAAAVPGALALAYCALAASVPGGRAEFDELARTTGQQVGLSLRPWEWLPVGEAGETGLRIDCFGTLRVRVDGAEVGVEAIRPRARSLLRLLAMNGGAAVHRVRIVDALWPDMTDTAATHNLQVAVSAIRKLLLDAGAPVRIAREGDAYRLLTDRPAAYDVAEFTSALLVAGRARSRHDHDGAADALGLALSRYAGDLLSEEGDAEWVFEARERHRTKAADAAATLAELELARGNPDAAADTARQGVHIDRWHDRSWRALVQAHLDRGDRAAAHRAETSYNAMLAALDLADE